MPHQMYLSVQTNDCSLSDFCHSNLAAGTCVE